MLSRLAGPFDSFVALSRSGQAENSETRQRQREPAGEILNAVKDLGLVRLDSLSRAASRPQKHFNLTLGEESCYILEVPRVRIGLPVYSLSPLVVCGEGDELSAAAFALNGCGLKSAAALAETSTCAAFHRINSGAVPERMGKGMQVRQAKRSTSCLNR